MHKRTTDSKLSILAVDRHRNGICGAPFHVVLFLDPEEQQQRGPMVAVVFDNPGHVAVLAVGDRETPLNGLAKGEIGFGRNSWRGDRYEARLRAAIRDNDTFHASEFETAESTNVDR